MTYLPRPVFLKRACALALITSLSAGCGSFRQQITDLGPTLADLPEAQIPEVLEPVAVVPRAEIEAMYRSALSVAEDPDLRRQIQVRLADITMSQSEEQQLASDGGGRFFDETISMYDSLINVQKAQEGVVDERLLYRVSKAYALDARMGESETALAELVAQNPDSAFAAEAQFRRAELAFSQQDYRRAHELYTDVVAFGDQTPFYLNAVYMQGWALFKQDRYHASLDSFAHVMDKVLPEGTRLEDLSDSQQNLLADTLKVFGFAFSYLDGAKSIAEFADATGERHYQHLLYRQLGDLYLDKKRYRDAAETYSAFVERYPNSGHSPELTVKTIDVYLTGGFAKEVLPAKESYIQRFGLRSQFWQQRTPEQRAVYASTLETYLDEVSSFYHSEAQALVAANQQYAAGKLKRAPEPAESYFQKAAEYYQQILKTFPDNPRVAELTFLRGEALHDSGDLQLAVAAYEQVAFEFLDTERGATAGYAAILTLDKLIEQKRAQNITAEELAALETHRINTAISFADYYPADDRAVAVLTNAAERLYQQQNRERAIDIATRLTTWQPVPALEHQKTAWLVLAHSRFELEQYEPAEEAYRHLLTIVPPEASDHQAIVDRVAASMYKRAEFEIAAGAKSQGVNRLLTISLIAPGTELAMNGQYDAANYLIEMKAWPRAEKVLIDFAQRFPNNSLTKTIPPKLAVIYQETEQWAKAAEQLAVMSASDADPETKRSALYLSAELYQKSGELFDAADTYKTYIKRYPEPFDLALEAKVQLVELAKARGDVREQESWLQELIRTDAKAGSNRSARSTYLAAQAETYFANQDLAAYEAIRLTAPIKKTLKAKRSAMDRVLQRYKTIIDYGVAEFATEANHRIGEVYADLYADLLDSERPQGLDELTLEQYEIMLEEQAYPFKGKAVDMLAINAERSWQGFYDKWVKESFKALEELLPARYGKKETVIEVSQGVH